MQGTTAENKAQKKQMDVFSLFLVIVVIVSVVLAVLVYRQSFGFGLSLEPNNWSAFGSYMGGVFGPLISFLTLLAILKTIRLQKELLDTQRTEFEAMQALQVRTVDAQISQMEHANAELNRRILEETRINLLKIIDNVSSSLRGECEAKRKRLDLLLQWVVEGKASGRTEDIKKGTATIGKYEKRLAALMVLYGEICFEEYSDITSMRKHFQDGMGEIWAPISDPSTEEKSDGN